MSALHWHSPMRGEMPGLHSAHNNRRAYVHGCSHVWERSYSAGQRPSTNVDRRRKLASAVRSRLGVSRASLFKVYVWKLARRPLNRSTAV
nr:MAG TPA: hypothetical protein [Caudoviricetes sp.]